VVYEGLKINYDVKVWKRGVGTTIEKEIENCYQWGQIPAN